MEERHAGGEKKIFQYCADFRGTILYLRPLQGHAGRSLIDPSLQDNVIILDGFFKYMYHVGCAINLHSIINSGLIPGGQNLSKRQTVFFCLWILLDKEQKDLEKIDLDAPRCVRHMQYSMEETSKYGVLGRYQTCSEERISSIRRDRTLSFFATHSQLKEF